MTQEEKDLLLKDLCARLPYGLKALNKEETITIRAYISDLVIDDVGISHAVEDCKPYLFPLLSMTEEQKKEYASLVWFNGLSRGWNSDDAIILDEVPMLIDFYHKNHIDYRGLIPKDLAIDATGLGIYGNK